MEISVIIPVYNSANTIERALNSILAQNYELSNVEIIIVNDGSSDNSLEIITNYVSRKKMQNVQIIDKKNGGVSSARNVGLKISKGQFISLLDSDDEWTPDKLKLQMKCFHDNPDIDLLGGLRKDEILDRFLFKRFGYLTRIYAKDILYKVFFSTPTLIFRRKILTTVGYFDENRKYGEDGNFLLKVCSKNNCFLLNEGIVITKGGLPDFGHSGLSANLKGMQEAINYNLKMALKMGIVTLPEYVFLYLFGYLKYIRRNLIANYSSIDKS